MRRAVLALAAALTTMVLVGVASPALAQDLVFRDPAGDVSVAEFSDTGDGDEGLVYHHSATRNGDVVATRYRHTRTRVLMFIHYRELFLPTTAAGWEFHVAGSNHVTRTVEVLASRGHVGGRVTMENRRGRDVHCDVSRRINYRTNSMWLSFPRSCLGSPKYVRIGNVSYWFTVRDDSALIYFDDPSRVGGTVSQVGGASRWIKSS